MGGAPQGGATPPVSAYPWGLEGFRWFFSIHASELNYDLNRARAALNEVVALGGVGVRTDIFWYDLEPQRGVTDAGRLAFYQGYLLLAQELGLKPLVILSGAPGWAVDLYRTNRALFWTSLESYARLVALIARDTTEHYQLWNEPNHLIDPIGEADDGELILRLGLIMRSFDPTAMLAVNAMCNVLGWEESVDRWLQAARGVIDVIGIDHYPGTWAGLSFTDWTPLQTLSRRINAPDDLWYGKTGAVMETGYSTWAAIVADEARQVAWVNESLAALRDLVGIFNRERPHKVLFGNYYQLIDVSTSGVGQEAHFGVLRSDLQRKPAFTALTLQLSQF